MKLWIMRHCYAGPPLADPRAERDRPLLAEGRATAKAMAGAMLHLGELPRVIFCSPFQRAIQTADVVGKELGIQVNVIGECAPMRPLENGIMGLVGVGHVRRVMLVAHVDNTTPAMNALGGDVEWKDLAMGEVRRVKIDRDSGEWSMKWSLCPSDIGLKDHAK